MSYKIPSEKDVGKIIVKVLKVRGVIESQSELNREVLKHLKRLNKNFKLTPKRMRRIALKTSKVKIEIRCKLTDKIVEDMKVCPVCGGKMEKITNATLEGKKIAIGFKCRVCPYWTGKNLRVPIRYTFRLKK